MTLLRRCPRCKSLKTSRSRRKLLERLLLTIKPYRCAECQHRFFSVLASDKVWKPADQRRFI